ncbi:MAG: hypothetical protein GY795_35680 [Desulfobacterales bacterium]|nr:hypothetical protein [Desulfobacterales bacterium]
MKRPQDFWSQIQRVFNPNEILTGERIKQLYCEREYSPFDRMLDKFTGAVQQQEPVISFFSGHRGSGKSSMLFHLLENLAHDFFVVYFDIDHNLDSNKANQIDLLYLLGATVYKTALNEGLNPDEKNLRHLVDSVYTVTHTKTEKEQKDVNIADLLKNIFCVGAGMLGSKLGEELSKALLKPFNLSSGISEETARKRETEPRVQDIVTNVNLIVGDVETKTDKPLLVIVDGLDKLPRIEQAKLIFLESSALREPLCNIIYTVPMFIFTHPLFTRIKNEFSSYFLPNIKVYDKETGIRYQRGYEELEQIVVRRLNLLNLKIDDVFERGALDLLIGKSGGLIRWFISMVYEAVTDAKIKELDIVNQKSCQEAVDIFSRDLTASLTRESIAELEQVRKDKRSSDSDIGRELLNAHFIVAYYSNHQTWFDAHPLIWDELKI